MKQAVGIDIKNQKPNDREKGRIKRETPVTFGFYSSTVMKQGGGG